jgi:hypothetical protein
MAVLITIASIAIILQLFSEGDSRCWRAQVTAFQKAAGFAARGHLEQYPIILNRRFNMIG